MPSSPLIELRNRLRSTAPERWLVTGAAGFIGSHLVEALLALGQEVIALDDFSTGHRANLEAAVAGAEAAAPGARERLRVVEADVTNADEVLDAGRGVHRILHHAALGSVPKSIEDPLATHAANVTGWLHVLEAARRHRVRRVVYASSSAIYGNTATLPLAEETVGSPLSPYAASKWIDEICAGVHARVYGVESIGLRYFNVFGPRQDPAGAYAAVIPKWTVAMIRGEGIVINGDGETTRDFCHVANVVDANLLAATTEAPGAVGEAYNVALGQRTTLNELFRRIRDQVRRLDPALEVPDPIHGDFRPGDVRHSLADISKARRLLGFEPAVSVADGLEASVAWFREHLA